jgi:hypothetical protein
LDWVGEKLSSIKCPKPIMVINIRDTLTFENNEKRYGWIQRGCQPSGNQFPKHMVINIKIKLNNENIKNM